MDINKVIRKQKKSYNRFLMLMCLVFFVLPLVMILTKRFAVFFIVYLSVIEALIFLAIFIRVNNETLKYEYDKYKLRIKPGIIGKEINIICDKVVLAHAEKKEDTEIVLVTSSRFRNKRLKAVNEEFLRSYSLVSHHYNRIKRQHPENDYYYLIIKHGKLHKYKLLDTIYSSCVFAYFTEDAIEIIKECRS